jgi:hypothetical protein
MSIRFDTGTDIVSGSFNSILTIGTGDFVIARWVYVYSKAATGECGGIVRQGFSEFMRTAYSNGSDQMYTATGAANGLASWSPALNTWYWVVSSRESSVLKFRAFADTTSTTPLASGGAGADSNNYATMNKVKLGTLSEVGTATLNCEQANFKVHTGVVWTNAECRTESQKFGIQKAGGDNRLCWGLETIDADTYGLNEWGGEVTLTNIGAINGASRPSQLEAAGGVTIPTYNKAEFKIGGSPIILNLNQPNPGYFQF